VKCYIILRKNVTYKKNFKYLILLGYYPFIFIFIFIFIFSFTREEKKKVNFYKKGNKRKEISQFYGMFIYIYILYELFFFSFQLE